MANIDNTAITAENFIKRVTAILGAITGLIAAAIKLAAQLTPVAIWIQSQVSLSITELVYWLQSATILLFIISLSRPRERAISADLVKAVTAAKQFSRFWSFLWYSLLAFYVVGGISAHYSVKVPILDDLFSGLAAAFLLLCYLVMVLKTVPVRQFGWHNIIACVVAVPLVVFLLEILMLGNPTKYAALEGYVTVAYGYLSGVALALFVGRLESRIISSPILIVAALYLYAMLQSTYGLIENPTAQTTAIVLSLILLLKILLFFRIERIIANDDLTYYMLEYRKIMDEGFSNKSTVLAELRGG